MNRKDIPQCLFQGIKSSEDFFPFDREILSSVLLGDVPSFL